MTGAMMDDVICDTCGHTDKSHVHNPIVGCTVYTNDKPCNCSLSQEMVVLYSRIRNRQKTEIELLERIIVLLERIHEDMPTYNLIDNRR